MARNKQKKFQEFAEFENTAFEGDAGVVNTLNEFTSKHSRIILELACGKGAYALALATKYPDAAVIGVDYQGERLWAGAKQATEVGLGNVLFLRARIENLVTLLPENSVDAIWITFPDPFPKDRHELRRLSSPRFLPLYKQLLKQGGDVNLKTDSLPLFEYSQQTLQEYPDTVSELKVCWNVDDLPEEHDARLTQTEYEIRHRREGKTIYWLGWAYSSAQ